MENINEEQLNEEKVVSLDAVEHNDKSDENLQGSSILNKFKTIDALSKAYENLEKEFTKKCQKLKSLEGENNENSLPQYKQQNWLSKVSEFLKDNENAKNYVNEIAEILSNDDILAKKEDALELAYSKVLKKNFKTKEELVKDKDFLENYIYSNNEIKNNIIEEYLLNLNNNKTIPLISSTRGSLSVSSPKFKPKDLKEAMMYAEKIMKK